MDNTNEFDRDAQVVVAAADPRTRVKGRVKAGPVFKDDGKMYFIHWDDGDKSWWRVTKLELYAPNPEWMNCRADCQGQCNHPTHCGEINRKKPIQNENL